MLEFLLSCERLLDQVSVETTETEDENAEKNGDEGAYHWGPELLEDLKEYLATAQMIIGSFISHFIVMDDHATDAQCCEQDNSQC